MSALTLEQIGMTQEELQTRVVATMVERLMGETSFDDDGDAYVVRKSELHKELLQAVRDRVDEKVKGLADEVMVETMGDCLDSLIFPHTNRYGEPVGSAVPVREHITNLVNGYLGEKVNADGRDPDYGSDGRMTRLYWIIGTHARKCVQEQVARYLEGAGEILAADLQKTVTAAIAQLKDAAATE